MERKRIGTGVVELLVIVVATALFSTIRPPGLQAGETRPPSSIRVVDALHIGAPVTLDGVALDMDRTEVVAKLGAPQIEKASDGAVEFGWNVSTGPPPSSYPLRQRSTWVTFGGDGRVRRVLGRALQRSGRTLVRVGDRLAERSSDLHLGTADCALRSCWTNSFFVHFQKDAVSIVGVAGTSEVGAIVLGETKPTMMPPYRP